MSSASNASGSPAASNANSSTPSVAAGALLARCSFPAPGTAVRCAFSGGPDSTALVALAVDAGLVVEAVHVHHGLRSGADDDAATAESTARDLGVTFRCEHVALESGPNLEARARDTRRQVLGADALTGHTADDQAETVLLQLLRGAAASGLSAMAPGPNHPILGLRRAETHALCAERGLRVALDPTNDDPVHRRNRIRHEVLPLLDAVADRDVVPLLERTASLLRDDDALLDELASALDPTDAVALTAAPVALARRAVRTWLANGGYPPDAAAVERVLGVARGDAIACEVAGIGRVSRTTQRLKLER